MHVLLGVILVILAFALLGKVGGIICIVIALTVGMRMGRRWGFNQLGAFENRERMRRAKNGGLGIF
jgi:hypothetical protein